MFEQIAKIRKTTLGFEDHGIFTVLLDLDYGGTGQGAGLCGLDGYNKETKQREGSPAVYDFITGVLRATGSRTWEQVAGKTVIALREGEGTPSDEWHAKVVGLKQLPTEGEGEFIFADAFKFLNE